MFFRQLVRRMAIRLAEDLEPGKFPLLAPPAQHSLPASSPSPAQGTQGTQGTGTTGSGGQWYRSLGAAGTQYSTPSAALGMMQAQQEERNGKPGRSRF